MADIAEKPKQSWKPLTGSDRVAFLEQIALGKSMLGAANAVGRHRDTFVLALKREPEFAAAFDAAFEASADILEEVAWDRATVPDKYGKISERLLEFLLTARNPRRYGRRDRVEVTGAGGGPVAHVVAHVDQRAVLATLAAAGLIAPELSRKELEAAADA